MLDDYKELIKAAEQRKLQEEFNVLKASGEQLLKYRPEQRKNLDTLLNCERYASVDKNPDLTELKEKYKEQDETLKSYSEEGGNIITGQANDINGAAFNVRRKHSVTLEDTFEERMESSRKNRKSNPINNPDHPDEKKILNATLEISAAALSLMKERFALYGEQSDEHALQVQRDLAEKERLELEAANRPLTRKQKVIKGFKNAARFTSGVVGKMTDHMIFEDSPKVKLTDAVKASYLEVYKSSKSR